MFSLTLDPLVHGGLPTWSAAAAATTYPQLVGNVLHGAITGLLLHFVAGTWTMKERAEHGPAPRAKVVVVGGGFGGVSAAQRFERLVLRGAKSDVLSNDAAEEAATLIADARLATISSAGHHAAGDNPESTVGLIRSFLHDQRW